MGIFAGPGVIEDGLVLALDAANLKGYDKYENLLRYSEQFDNSNWNNSGYGTIATITSNTTNSPDATLTADLINFAPDATNQSRRMQQVLSMSGTYTFSVFVKKNTLSYASLYLTASQSPYPSISYNFDTDIITGGTGVTNLVRTLYSDGWVRISGTATVTNHTGYFGPIGFDTGSTYYWGAQLERGSSVTDYYATTSTTKTRGTTWTDLSIGGGNNGTLVNGVRYNGSNLGSLVFDGTDDYCTISNASVLNSIGAGDFTVSMWIYRATNPPTGNGEMLYQSADLNDGFVICVSGTSFRIETRDRQSTNANVPFISGIFTAGVWNNVVLTKSNTTYNGYSQGIYKGGFTSYQDVSTTTGFVDIGRVNWWGPSHWEGNINGVKVYNRALTATEIQKNFNAQRGRFGI